MKRVTAHPSYRLARYIVIIALIVLGLTQLGWVTQKDTTYITVEVEEGDTLWQLASAVTDDQTDVRATVHDIVTRNNLAPNATIRPGQVLEVPVAAAVSSRVQAALQKR